MQIKRNGYVTGKRGWFSKLELLDKPMFIKIANSKLIPAEGKSQLILSGSYDRQKLYILLSQELMRISRS